MGGNQSSDGLPSRRRRASFAGYPQRQSHLHHPTLRASPNDCKQDNAELTFDQIVALLALRASTSQCPDDETIRYFQENNEAPQISEEGLHRNTVLAKIASRYIFLRYHVPLNGTITLQQFVDWYDTIPEEKRDNPASWVLSIAFEQKDELAMKRGGKLCKLVIKHKSSILELGRTHEDTRPSQSAQDKQRGSRTQTEPDKQSLSSPELHNAKSRGSTIQAGDQDCATATASSKPREQNPHATSTMMKGAPGGSRSPPSPPGLLNMIARLPSTPGPTTGTPRATGTLTPLPGRLFTLSPLPRVRSAPLARRLTGPGPHPGLAAATAAAASARESAPAGLRPLPLAGPGAAAPTATGVTPV